MSKKTSHEYNKNVVSFILPYDYKMQLAYLSQAENISISELARSIVMSYLNKHSVMKIVIDYMTEIVEK